MSNKNTFTELQQKKKINHKEEKKRTIFRLYSEDKEWAESFEQHPNQSFKIIHFYINFFFTTKVMAKTPTKKS